jgi:SpoVK/Ycf46/Vps4 family AAA+-type ATPase
MEPPHELEVLIRAGHPLLVVDTHEEERLEGALHRIATAQGLGFFVWTAGEGLRRDGHDRGLYDSKEPEKALRNIRDLTLDAIWFFKDLHQYLENPELLRQLRALAGQRSKHRRTIVLAAPKIQLPAMLEKVAVRYRMALPDENELRKLVLEVVRDLGRLQPLRVELDDAAYRRLVEGLKGLTLFQAERAVTEAVLDDLALTAADVETVQRAKRELLSQGGVLEYVPTREHAPALGGLETFKTWVAKRKRAFTEEAKAFGLPTPKGIVLLGVQGCGKTMAARAVADLWDIPLLKMEAGRLYDMYMGESEKNLEEALWLAEHLSPCVLLVDEIEKGFASAGGAAADGGLSKRILGRLLGWLQDRTAPVFVVATCNRVQELPPELLRKGRFDEIFFVDLPTEEERREILALHLRLRERDPAGFDLERLAAAGEGFSGAELEQAIVAALYTAFAAGSRVTSDLLEEEIRGTRPLSVTRREEVEALRAWARERAVPAR